MATAYVADTYADIQVGGPPSVAQIFARPFKFSIANTTSGSGFALNDTLALCPIPYKDAGYGCLVLGYHIEIPELDTGSSVTIDLGDTNASSNAFQATFVSAAAIGQTTAGVLDPIMCFSGTTAVAPVRGVVPKQYTVSSVQTAQSTGFTGTINFELKIHVAPNTATTTGIIKGYLLLMQLQASSQTF